ncbi:SIS domain-containing protein [Rhizobium sp.]
MKTEIGRALNELGACLDGIDQQRLDELVELIATSKRIVLYGCGREGLMMRALCMRLYHLGLDVHMVFDMTTPPVGTGDLLLVSAGPGYLTTVEALLGVARAAGAATACFTAVAGSQVTRSSDFTLLIPAQTMASDQAAPTSFLPMGSLYEGAQFLLYEILVMRLKERLDESAEGMRARHTNLE